MKRRAQILLAGMTIVVLLATCGWAQEVPRFRPKGTVIKYDQPIRHVIDDRWPTDMANWGEDIPSDVDWNKIMQSPTIEPTRQLASVSGRLCGST
jgi:hypothetical protein